MKTNTKIIAATATGLAAIAFLAGCTNARDPRALLDRGRRQPARGHVQDRPKRKPENLLPEFDYEAGEQ